MKDNILLIVSIVLLVGIAVAVFFIIDYSNLNEGLTADNKQLSNKLADTVEELEESQDEVAVLEDEKGTLVDETTALSTDIAGEESLIADLMDSRDTLQLSYDDFSDFTYCSGSEFEDYSPSSTTYGSRDPALIAFLLWFFDNFYETDEGRWFPFWDDEMSPLYFQLELEDEFDVFLIFLEDSSLGTTGGLFYVNEQCWVDQP